MKPVNSKSLFATLCTTLEKLDNNEIDTQKASAIAKVTGTALNFMVYELKRDQAMSDHKIKAEHRNIEMKDFDYLPE